MSFPTMNPEASYDDYCEWIDKENEITEEYYDEEEDRERTMEDE